MVTIDKRLNLVIPILREDETKLYVHSTPIRHETFEAHYMVLAKTFSTLMHNGLDPSSGPAVAAMVLKDVARNTTRGPGLNWFDGPDGVGGEAGLLAEFVRLSNVVVPSKAGWGTLPLRSALDQRLLDSEEESEVINRIAFFMVVSLVPSKPDRGKLIEGMARIYDLRTTYFNSTEYATSLKILTKDETTGESLQP